MTTIAIPLVSRPNAPLARLNPVTKLGAALVVMAALLVTGDLLTPALVLAVELVVIAASGIGLRTFLFRLWLLLVAAAGLGVSTFLLTAATDRFTVAAAMAVRIVAIALPGVWVFATTDPTEFADALVQHLKAPARFTFGALAAFRLVPLLGDEWRTLLLARRARGIDAGWNPVKRLRLFASATFALLVAAIRRGVRLATAMEARGFGKNPDRTIARPQRIGPGDWAFLVGTVLVVAGAIAVSLAVGSWRFLF